VPDPDITSLPDSSSEDFESGSEVPIQCPASGSPSIARPAAFLKRIYRLNGDFCISVAASP
jgi:hypothetical protein